MRYAQTMAFTTLVLAQLFNVFNSRSDSASAFAVRQRALAGGRDALSVALQGVVLYVPPLQRAFGRPR